jgi:sulfide dehydrogenase cytochrome subunit
MPGLFEETDTRNRKLAKSLAIFAACGAAAFGSLCHADDSIGRAGMLAHSCTVCHGTEGNGSLSIPKIRGLDRTDIAQSLKGFRSGEERQTIMGRIAKAFTDEEIELLATYYAAL